MEKITLGPDMSVFPMPVAIIGALVDGKPNFMTVGWISRAFRDPPLLAMAINRAHHTWRGIEQTGVLSVNFPSVDQVAEADYVGIVSGEKTDKSELFDVFYGELAKAPMIRDCPLCFECELVDGNLPHSPSLLLARIIQTYTEARYLTDGNLDPDKARPFVLAGPDRTYRALGEVVGIGWKEGLKIK
jgi:flavin reductase (DIM6/NTAB) family NADH-FMN oxidoreductase RutF